jgi:hypothetical protein
MEMIIFWDVKHYSPVEVNRRFGGTSVNVYQTIWHYILTDSTLSQNYGNRNLEADTRYA